MGRKSQRTATAEKLNEATAEAARILSSDVAYLSKMMREFIDAALKAKDRLARADLFNRAMELPPVAASLGDTIGRLNGETRQHISVERTPGGAERPPKSTAIAPQNAPNKTARGDENPKDSLEKSAARCLEPGPKPGEGGE